MGPRRLSAHSVSHARVRGRVGHVPQAHVDRGDAATTAKFKIRIGPLAQLSASLQLPRTDAREMLRALVVLGLASCGIGGPVLTLWVGTTMGLPAAGTLGIASAEMGLAAFICWRVLATRSPEPPSLGGS